MDTYHCWKLPAACCAGYSLCHRITQRGAKDRTTFVEPRSGFAFRVTIVYYFPELHTRGSALPSNQNKVSAREPLPTRL